MTIRKIFFIVFAINCLLILLHVLFGSRFDLLNLDRERTPGAYWSGLQLLSIAGIAITIGLLSIERLPRMLWVCFSIVFIGFGFDEISELHENITYYALAYVPFPDFFQSPTYNWLVLLSPIIFAIFFFLFFFVRTLRQENLFARRLIFFGILFFLAALGIELASGLNRNQLLHNAFIVIEEAFELFGESILLLGVITIAREHFIKQFVRKT